MRPLMDVAVDVGTTKRLDFVVESLDHIPTPIDPSSVTLHIKDPAGNVTTRTVLHAATGKFYSEFVATTPGQWWYRWESVGPQRSDEGSFVVRRSRFDEDEPPVEPQPMTWTI